MSGAVLEFECLRFSHGGVRPFHQKSGVWRSGFRIEGQGVWVSGFGLQFPFRPPSRTVPIQRITNAHQFRPHTLNPGLITSTTLGRRAGVGIRGGCTAGWPGSLSRALTRSLALSLPLSPSPSLSPLTSSAEEEAGVGARAALATDRIPHTPRPNLLSVLIGELEFDTGIGEI